MFENEIIKLRKLAASDYTTYHDWRNDLDEMKMTSPQLDVYTLEDTEQYISTIVSQTTAKGYLTWIPEIYNEGMLTPSF